MHTCIVANVDGRVDLGAKKVPGVNLELVVGLMRVNEKASRNHFDCTLVQEEIPAKSLDSTPLALSTLLLRLRLYRRQRPFGGIHERYYTQY